MPSSGFKALEVHSPRCSLKFYGNIYQEKVYGNVGILERKRPKNWVPSR